MSKKENPNCYCGKKKFPKEEHCIFHCNKTVNNDWFTENSDGTKFWDKKLVNIFWEEIREDKMKKDYDFSWFIFPEGNSLLNIECSIEKLGKNIKSILLEDFFTWDVKSKNELFISKKTVPFVEVIVTLNNAIPESTRDALLSQ